jgi:hypothetical protein
MLLGNTCPDHNSASIHPCCTCLWSQEILELTARRIYKWYSQQKYAFLCLLIRRTFSKKICSQKVKQKLKLFVYYEHKYCESTANWWSGLDRRKYASLPSICSDPFYNSSSCTSLSANTDRAIHWWLYLTTGLGLLVGLVTCGVLLSCPY